MTTEAQTPEADEIEIVHVDEAPAAPAAPASPAAVTVDEGVNDLKRQLEDSRAAQARAEAAARAAQQESLKFRTEAEQSQYAAISRALDAAAGELESAEAQYAAALEAGDYKAAARAQVAMTKATTKQTSLETGKAQMDAMRADPRYQQRQVPQPAQNDFEARISSMSQRTQSWLRAHPDAITDPIKQNKVMAAHHDALAEGHAPDSDGYFAFVEQRAGYRQPPAQATQRAANPSAPVSGQARQPSGQKARESVTMTPRMRQLAREQGVSEAAWAKAYLAGIKDGTQEPLN